MKNSHFTFILLFVIFLLILAISLTPTPTDWGFSYSAYDKNPHGSYVIFNELDQIFDDAEIEVTDSSVYQTIRNRQKENSLLLIIGDSYYSDESEFSNRIDSFVFAGNQIFISANYIDFFREDSSIMGLQYVWSEYDNTNEYNEYLSVEKTAKIEANIFYDSDSLTYEVPLKYMSQKIITDSTFHFKLGAYDKKGSDLSEKTMFESNTNFIKIPYGDGNFYFHSNPGVFTNNAMLYEGLSDYATALLSHVPDVEYIIWDEYNKPGRSFLDQAMNNKLTPWKFIKQHKGLHFAMILTIIGSLMLIFMKGKREQQAIPVIKPKENQTVDFAKTMGQFYYEKSQHLDIAKKRMTYFEADFRKKYNIQNIEDYRNKRKELRRITGIKDETLVMFFKYKLLINQVETLSKERLQNISNCIEKMKAN